MSGDDAAPPCPTCPDDGDVREFGSGWTCDECAVVFAGNAASTSIAGPRVGHPSPGTGETTLDDLDLRTRTASDGGGTARRLARDERGRFLPDDEDGEGKA